MLVSQILRGKGRVVVQVERDATLGAAAAVLAQHRIGAVLVLDQAGGPAGILSERDIVRAIAAEGAAALSSTVASRMSSPVETCQEGDTIQDLAEAMSRGRFRHLPVVENGRVVGLVSIGDVVKSRIEETVAEADALKSYIATG